jgi:hypothetical protein
MRVILTIALASFVAASCGDDGEPAPPTDAGALEDAFGVPPRDAGDGGGGGGGDAFVSECDPTDRDSIVTACDHWAFACNDDFDPTMLRSFATCVGIMFPTNVGTCGDDPTGDCETNCQLLGGVATCVACTAPNGPVVPMDERLSRGASCTTNNECALECCLDGACI